MNQSNDLYSYIFMCKICNFMIKALNINQSFCVSFKCIAKEIYSFKLLNTNTNTNHAMIQKMKYQNIEIFI